MDYSKGSLASNKFEWINIPKPSTDTTHFRVVESLEIPGYEDKSKNTYPSEVTSGAAQYPWGCSLLTHCQAHDFFLQGPALDRSMFYHCSTFKTDVSCQSNEEKLALGMCSVAQWCCVSHCYLCSSSATSQLLPQKETEITDFFLQVEG